MKWLILVTCLITNIAFAQLDSREVVSQNFTSYGDIRGEDIKRALLHQAATRAIQKFAGDLGFDFNSYQEKLSQNFQDYYEQQLANSDESQAQMTAQDIYRKRQFDFFNYSKHTDLLRSFSFISVSKNPDVANQW